jgi:uncharacterized membrane protein
MTLTLAQAASAASAAFLASLVECVEALTVVLAVGATRGWGVAVAGAALAACVLILAAAVCGPALAGIDPAAIQCIVGGLVLLFGLRWLRKAILRAAGAIPLHDEARVYAGTQARLAAGAARRGWDWLGFAASFQVVMLEGTEVAFIVIAIGAGTGRMRPASLGAALALVCVGALGILLHRPLTRIPENTLKCVVGILLVAFGTFWTGEGIGLRWPAGEWGLPLLTLFWAGLSAMLIVAARAKMRPVRQ